MSFEHGSLHAVVPRAWDQLGHAPGDAFRNRKIIGGESAALAYLLHYPGGELRMLFQEFLETPGAHTMCLHAMAQQRPRFHWNYRCFMCPLLGELAPTVDYFVE